MFSRLNNALKLIRKGHFLVLFNEIKKRFYSESVSLGLQKDLKAKFEVPPAKINIRIRPLRKEDLVELLDTTIGSSINPRIIAHQRSMVNEDIPTCYVAVTPNNKPCFMQWLIGYDENPTIKKFFKGAFPQLKKSEALMEGGFSNPSYRGLLIMPMTMALVAKKAAEMNVRWINTFVDVTNIPSLKGCQRAGFKPYLMRIDRWFLFNRTITFHPISDSMIDIFYQVTESERHQTSPKHQSPMLNHTPKVDKYH